MSRLPPQLKPYHQQHPRFILTKLEERREK